MYPTPVQHGRRRLRAHAPAFNAPILLRIPMLTTTNSSLCANRAYTTRAAVSTGAGTAEGAAPLIAPAELPATTPRNLIDEDSRFANIQGVLVHHKVWNQTEREDERRDSLPKPTATLVCLHGFGASLTSYELGIGSLRKVAPVVALDAPGFGRTIRPPLRRLWRYTPAYAGAVLANALAAKKPHVLVGHSMGALGVLEAAMVRRPRAVVLIAPAIAPPPKFPRVLRVIGASCFIAVSLLIAPVFALLLRRAVRSDEFWRKGLSVARFNTNPDQVPDDVVAAYSLPRDWPKWDAGLFNFVRAMALYRATSGDDSVRMLKEIAQITPVLIVHGDADRIVPIKNSRILYKAIPNIQLAEIENVGHVPHEEVPEKFADIVDAFLEQSIPPVNRDVALDGYNRTDVSSLNS